MGYLGRRIGLSQDNGDSNPGAAGGAVGGGLLDLFTHGYFERKGDLYNHPGSGLISGLTATGGVVSDYTTAPGDVYRAHIFTSSGTFDVSALSENITNGNTLEYLVVGGGGGGGFTSAVYTGGGGGGAGGLRTNLSGHPLAGAAFPVSISSYTVIVGAGGDGGSNAPFKGSPGGNSEFHAPPLSYPNAAFIRGAGGGGGGNASDGTTINIGDAGNAGGGSGGGTSFYANPEPRAGGAAGAADANHPAVAGNAGGTANPGSGYGTISSGGGGAGGAGADGKGPPGFTSPGPGLGKGGVGAQVLIAGPPASDQPIGTSGPVSGGGYFAGGGGGGAYNGPGTSPTYTPSTFTAPPGGGGGSGYMGPGSGVGYNGTYSTGGGGGGGGTHNPGSAQPGGNGASGIVVVRYKIAELTATAKATGGAISFYGDKTIHTFTSSGTFATKANWSAGNVEYIVVGGGGSGGGGWGGGGGGGGAGAYRAGTTPVTGTNTSVSIVVGAGD